MSPRLSFNARFECMFAFVALPASQLIFLPTLLIEASGRKRCGNSGVTTSNIVDACSATVDQKRCRFLRQYIYMYTYVSISSQPIPSSISGSGVTKYLYEVNNGAGDFDFDFDIVVVASQNGTAREGKAHSRVVIKVVSYPRSVHYTS